MPYARAVAVLSFIRRKHLSPEMCAASLTARRCASVKNTGTLITQSRTSLPWSAAAIFFKFWRIMATSCVGLNTRFFPHRETFALATPSFPSVSSKLARGTTSFWKLSSEKNLPIKFLGPSTVFFTFEILCESPCSPMNRWAAPNDTMDGVLRWEASFETMSTPFLLAMATTLLSLPRSIPSTAPVGAPPAVASKERVTTNGRNCLALYPFNMASGLSTAISLFLYEVPVPERRS
mmetsp:Transcript_36410/g.74730  ORF Transcript_36410/g.74730 Transcript_36410/m.74730 type:complete len:235 (+) Transcript_36410:823-1527(+)